jgi:catechol 2,3-dioxygenase-like lactoylglutathione lyase family enzyme
MLEIGSVVWGVRDLQRAVQFWTAALDYHAPRKPTDDWVILVPRERSGIQFALSLVSSEAGSHQRHHLDLYASDQKAEVDRLIGLGAETVDWRYEPDADYVVLADPDGNRFCVVQLPRPNT